MGAMRGRDGGKSGGSGRIGGILADKRMVALGAEAAVVEGVGMVGTGAVGGGRVVVGEIIVDIGAGKGVLEAVAVTALSSPAGCGESFETFFHALSRKFSFLSRDFGGW